MLRNLPVVNCALTRRLEDKKNIIRRNNDGDNNNDKSKKTNKDKINCFW